MSTTYRPAPTLDSRTRPDVSTVPGMPLATTSPGDRTAFSLMRSDASCSAVGDAPSNLTRPSMLTPGTGVITTSFKSFPSLTMTVTEPLHTSDFVLVPDAWAGAGKNDCAVSTY